LTEETNARVEELTASLVATFQHLQDSGGNFSDLIEEQRPAIEEILINLQATTRNLSEFSRILADQPSALIRGKAERGRKGGE
jgi:vacuolar-type H+-ATPase subunit I/STV1